MSKYVLLVETGADLPKALAERFNIHDVPMHVSFGSDTRDDGSFPIAELFSYFGKTGTLPKTSGSTVHDFEQVFDALHAMYPDKHIVHLAYSAVTTCSYQSAKIAAEDRPYPITSIDTKHVSAGQTAVALAVARFIESKPDATIEEIEALVEKLRVSCKMGFFPGDLAYLKAGGRVNNAAYLGAKILSLNPLIEINDGRLEATKKYRGTMSRIAPKMLRDFAEEKQFDRRIVFFVYSEGLSEAIKADVENTARELGFAKTAWIPTGSVVSTHAGPGAFGVVGFSEDSSLSGLYADVGVK